MAHRTVRGRIRYTSKKPEMMDRERGREWFAFTHHGDGAVTLRAQCEIEEPAPTVLRDIVYSLDADGRPFDCLVRLTVGDRFMGSGLITFHGSANLATCVSHGPSIGRIEQTLPINASVDGFGTHPIVGDGYLTRCIDTSNGPTGRTIHVLVPSPDHRGATPPMLARVSIDLEYLGDETVTVAAGTFDCRKFQFIDRSEAGMGGNQHPAYQMWVTADDDALFVQGGVGGYMATWYELVELIR
ncbi:hypothetical protein H3309_08790 [Sandaracinobacteroides saxicola]|uniref:DUF3108 domain-containing protein n=2 Tax=Sandaracinobacteroides saxicola TaxID=2759707 RepID=A0A7G5IMJ8_9SPHN|nr:hypothetical protein H3309_08790 [Sandaracinobacteroides saxicola]